MLFLTWLLVIHIAHAILDEPLVPEGLNIGRTIGCRILLKSRRDGILLH